MEPKTWQEYWNEGLKNAVAKWNCKYISKPNWQYGNHERTYIKIFADCEIDVRKRECEGYCSKYKKSWFRKISDMIKI